MEYVRIPNILRDSLSSFRTKKGKNRNCVHCYGHTFPKGFFVDGQYSDEEYKRFKSDLMNTYTYNTFYIYMFK